MHTLRFALSLWSTMLKASLALRGAFLLQAAFMLANNLLLFVTWWVLFQRFDDVRGYRMPDMLALFGLSAAGYGLKVVLFGGALDLAHTIAEGRLDALLTQPKSVLLRAVSSRSRASGWGDLASGILMLGLSGYVTLARAPLVLYAVLLTTLVMLSFAVLLNSLAFWVRDIERTTFNAFHFLIAFTLYPPTLFGGTAKLFLFTVLPVGLAVYLPVSLVRGFDAAQALWASAGAIAYAAVAATVFARGLSRYASGSRIEVMH
jgi:ABC-2 type transport system permease protein